MHLEHFQADDLTITLQEYESHLPIWALLGMIMFYFSNKIGLAYFYRKPVPIEESALVRAIMPFFLSIQVLQILRCNLDYFNLIEPVTGSKLIPIVFSSLSILAVLLLSSIIAKRIKRSHTLKMKLLTLGNPRSFYSTLTKHQR
mmetsp:Transcript_1869/g.2563  ORF Transcript_1869/g.2563 Transcript_1869/m.2563 type:complete len:144 (+) Transcript_1869:1790-2221(+)